MTEEKQAAFDKEISDRVAELSAQYKCKIHPVIFGLDDGKQSDERIVGYLKEPPRTAKVRAMDKAMNGVITAAEELVEVCLLKEESDWRMSSEAPEWDYVHMGLCLAANNLVKSAQNLGELKKK